MKFCVIVTKNDIKIKKYAECVSKITANANLTKGNNLAIFKHASEN